MYFWKIDDETIRCLINKQEIDQMGFNIQELSSNEESMSDFLNAIVDNSLNYIAWNTEHGVQNYIARSLPADQFLLTISCTYPDDAIDRDLKQIEKMTDALNEKITRQRLLEIFRMQGEEKQKAFGALTKDLHDVCNGKIEEETQRESEPVKDDAPGFYIPDQVLTFSNFDHMVRFSSMLSKEMLFPAELYKIGETYTMIIRLSVCKDENTAMSFILTGEECGGICTNLGREDAYVKEHGLLMIGEDALKILHDFA